MGTRPLPMLKSSAAPCRILFLLDRLFYMAGLSISPIGKTGRDGKASSGSTIAYRKPTDGDVDPHFFSNAASTSFCVTRALGLPG
jgi:hypothetical protein